MPGTPVVTDVPEYGTSGVYYRHAVPDRFQEDAVWVHDQVVVSARRIVPSAAGGGFWHVLDSPIPDDAITRAVFGAHSCGSFIRNVR